MAKILIVEDDVALSQVLRVALLESGHNVMEAFDGTTASKIMKKKSFDLIVADIFLPEKDGLELIREVKKGAPEVKIIAISGGGKRNKDSHTYLKAAMSFGADRRIDKPFEITELLESIEELLDWSKAADD